MEPCERGEGRSLRQVLHTRSASKGGEQESKSRHCLAFDSGLGLSLP